MDNWELITKYLAGECTKPEEQEFQTWLAQEPANLETFQKLEKVWANTAQDISEVTIDTEKAWQRISSQTQPQTQNSKSVSFWQWAGRVAAILVLAVGVVWLVNQSQTPDSQLVVADTGIQQVTLDDGTKVWLNKGSSLRFPAKFEGKQRLVNLEGEAFFEVARREDQPFKILAQETVTQVLGTSFNLDATQGVKISVVSGKVAFYQKEKQDERITLTKGESAVFAGQKITKNEFSNPNEQAWRTKKLVFEQRKLNEVIAEVNTLYEAKIILKNQSLGDCPLTVTFENKSLKEVLDVLKLTLDLSIQKQTNNSYLITGEACN